MKRNFDAYKYFKIIYKEGEPCKHPGCLSHMTHPCEGCGRIGGRGDVIELKLQFSTCPSKEK
jgi:hypothetical protein